jgi:hypothetical protein
MSLIRRLGFTMINMGVDPRKTWSFMRGIPAYISDIIKFRSLLNAQARDEFQLTYLPMLSDRYESGGTAKGHYFHQDLWASRHIFKQNPGRHIDVGSRVDGFIAHLLTFRSVEVVDVRPMQSDVTGLSFLQGDMMDPATMSDVRAESVSCLHALEHFGLGRYGDPMVIDGWKKGISGLAAMVGPDGRLYLSVPIGKPRIEFNANRIFSPSQIILEVQSHGFDLIEFAYIDDNGDMNPTDHADSQAMQTCATFDYGCGCFLFARTKANEARNA